MLPDLTVLLDADPKVSLARVSNVPNLFDGSEGNGTGRIDNENERRFEEQPLKFHQDIRKGYLALSKHDARWCIIRADQAGHRVADAILKRVRRLLIEREVPETVFKG